MGPVDLSGDLKDELKAVPGGVTMVSGLIWTNLVPNMKLTFFFKNILKWSTRGV